MWKKYKEESEKKKAQTKTETKLDRLNEQTKKENKILSIYALPLIDLSFFLSTSAMLYKYNALISNNKSIIV